MRSALSVKDSLVLGVPFAVAVGTCHSLGYWGHFEINALQFVALTDIAKLAVYPLAFLVLSTLLSIAYTEVGIRAVLPLGDGRDTPIGRFGVKYWRLFVIADIFAIFNVAVFVPEPMRWYLIAVLVVPFSTLLTHLPSIIELFPNPRFRAALLLQVVSLPLLAFAHGRATALRVDSGDAPLYVDAHRSGLPLFSSFSEPVVYVGKLGETFVLLEFKTRRLVLIKTRDDTPFVLRRNGS